MSWYTDNFGPLYIETPQQFSDLIRKEFDKFQMRATLVPDIDWEIKYCDFNSNIFKKETNKMEAKKCDRCGKLYEMPSVTENEGAEVRFKFIKVSDVENKSGTKIAKEQMRNIYIKKTSCCDSYSGVDLCPECRKSLKKWFEGTDKEEKKDV